MFRKFVSLAVLSAALITENLFAATLTVTTATDGAAGSLRNRIGSATAGDVIVFDASLAGQSLPLTSEIIVPVNLTITATNLSGGVTIQGNSSARLFFINFGVSVAMSGMNFTGGGAAGATDNNRGGAFNVYGSLTLTGCKVYGNTAFNAFSGFGGAISVASSGTLVATDCAFYGNSATRSGVFTSAGSLTFSKCLISSNAAVQTSGLGGDYAIGSGGGNATLVNCTFTANTAAGVMGILNNGTLTMVHCTYVNNASGGGSGSILNFGTAINMTNCIVTGNAPSNVDNQSGAFNSVSNLIGTAALLGPLTNNGGATLTMALLSNSPAINTGLALAGVTTDQRGKTRPQFGAPDIGAFERTAADAGQTVVNTGGADWYLGAPPQGNDLSIYREASGQAPVNVGGSSILIGLANDGTVVVKNSVGNIYSRVGSTGGIGSVWVQQSSVFAGDGAAWFLGPDSSSGSLNIYRWANSGLPAYSSGSGTNLSVLFDGSILTIPTGQTTWRRIGSNSGLGSTWQQVFIASAAPALGSTSKVSNNFKFGFTGQASKTFSVYASTNLTLPVAQWTAIGSAVETSAGNYSFTDPAATNSPQRYYRVTSP